MKDMTITYEVDGALYVNITNRCSNRCDFCIRNNGDGAYGSNTLWLAREPSCDEIYDSIVKSNPDNYSELVFCGYGEPTERLDDLLEVAKRVKDKYSVKIRINTNGHSSLIHGYDTAPKYEGVIDVVSISLNAPSAEGYEKVCHSVFREAAFDGLLDFASRVKNYVKTVVLTVVDVALTKEEIAECQRIADEVGVPLRVRKYIGKE